MVVASDPVASMALVYTAMASAAAFALARALACFSDTSARTIMAKSKLSSLLAFDGR
jgi:hypothetical protein